MTAFDPQGYWEERLSRHYTLDGVGYLGLGESYNAWMYRVRRRVFLNRMRGLFPEPSGLRVLDVGSGTGFYVDRWHELGVSRVTGSDITDVAVENLRRRHPDDTFVQFDAGGEDQPFGREHFTVVSMIDVLYHIVDDVRHRRSFANVYELLEPGGYFVFSENFLHGDAVRGLHQVSRSLPEIERSATEAGFEIIQRRPVYVLMNAPIDSGSQLRRGWWRIVQRVSRRGDAFGSGLGALLYPLELALVSRMREGPSTELMICRRPVSGRIVRPTPR